MPVCCSCPKAPFENCRSRLTGRAPDADELVNQQLKRRALERLLAYQHRGNEALGVYNDRRDAVDVANQFAFMLSYSEAFSFPRAGVL